MSLFEEARELPGWAVLVADERLEVEERPLGSGVVLARRRP